MSGISPEIADLAVPIADLKPYPRNARKGDTAKIAASLDHHGQYRPIVVNRRTNEVLAGNHTMKAAEQLGWTEIAATFVDADPDQAARIVLVDNRANDTAGYDETELAAVLAELGDLSGTGYEPDDLTELLQKLGADFTKEGLNDPDEIPEIPDAAETITNAGDVWTLGDHRLICGDATDQATIDTLMAGEDALLLLTDPPYGVSYVGGTADKLTIENDDRTGADLEAFLTASIGAAGAALAPGAPAYIFHADTNRVEFQRAMEAAQIPHRQTVIWAKNQFVLGRQDYQWQHEPILYGWREGAAHRWFGDFDKGTLIDELADPAEMSKDDLVALVRFIREQVETTVVHCDRPKRSELHPTTKPVALLERLLNNSSRHGDAVLDPFGGSGSTLIACQRLSRRAFLAELDPSYCDVIVQRWEQHSGDQASREPGAGDA